mgnify:FL=1|tara:strand:+ start:89 stop:283 length:195 start_codon:yes stop_codon:yes gene_type:complete
MKLSNIEFELIWDSNHKLETLRKYILDNIEKRGEVLRWSINNIVTKNIEKDQKIITITAVIINK